MVVHVKLGSVRWLKADKIARRPRRKRVKWLLAAEDSTIGAPRISAVRNRMAPRGESIWTPFRLPKARHSALLWFI